MVYRVGVWLVNLLITVASAGSRRSWKLMAKIIPLGTTPWSPGQMLTRLTVFMVPGRRSTVTLRISLATRVSVCLVPWCRCTGADLARSVPLAMATLT